MPERFSFFNKQERRFAPGVRPIFVSVVSREDLKTAGITRDAFEEGLGLQDPKTVVWQGSSETTPLDASDKFSRGFYPCVGLVVTGRDRKTGKNISFLSHQNPDVLTGDKRNGFRKLLRKILEEVQEKCEAATIDAVLAGGTYNQDRETRQAYLEQIVALSGEVERAFGFEPVALNGPKVNLKEGDDIYYDNQNRRLYLVRPKVNESARDFVPSQAGREEKRWR